MSDDTAANTSQSSQQNGNKSQENVSTSSSCILVEIVSALNVPNVDRRGKPDPYVVVSAHGEDIHQTDVMYNTEFPIWSLDTGSLFIVVSSMDDHVQFTLKEYDALRRDPTLGTFDLPVEEMRQGIGERTEHHLIVPPIIQEISKSVQKKIQRATRLVLRYKPATPEDTEFLKTLQTKKAGRFCKETYLPPIPSCQDEATGTTGLMPTIPEWGQNYFTFARQTNSIDPNHPDPMLTEAMKPSKEWINVGDPDAPGKVYVEVLACNGLPNLDNPNIFEGLGNLTDAFCCLILEDSIVNTSYVSDNLNPRWMPTGDHRAFVFGVHHPSSHLYIGVFNHNSTSKIYKPLNAFYEWTHTPIGRVLVNLTHGYPETLYTLHYHLYEVSCDSAKNRLAEEHRGTLIIRYRIEWAHQVMAGMSLPPEFFVSVPRKHDFQTATYTTVGERGVGEFSIKDLSSYVEELQAYTSMENVDMVLVAVLTVMLWRGTYNVTIRDREMNLPLNSMVAFTWGVLVTNDYNRFPSFVAFSIAWLLLLSAKIHRLHPSPWHKCESYPDLMRALIAELLSLTPLASRVRWVRKRETIVANQNIDKIKPYMEEVRKRKALAEEVRLKKEQELEDEVKQHAAEMAVISEDSVATAKVSNMARKTVNVVYSANPLKPILHPVQKILYEICIDLRIVKSVVSWDENYFAFWIVSLSFLISFAVFWIPWGCIMRWSIRILVWVLLGPWMRIVDWYYFEQVENMTQEEQERYIKQQAHSGHRAFQAQRLQSRTERETRVKLKSMMKYFFGKYVVRVPRFQQAQFLDDALPASTAEPWEGGTGGKVTTIGHVCGQTLDGDMIPTRITRTHPFLKEINYGLPSERKTKRFKAPKESVVASQVLRPQEKGGAQDKTKRKKRLSFKTFLKKMHIE